MDNVILSNRETGAIPVSIATSLAIEGLAGIGEYADKKSSINEYNTLWVNLRTLFRNLTGSMKAVDRANLTPSQMAKGLLEDILILESSLNDLSSGKIKLNIYLPDYSPKGFNRLYPNAIRKVPRTNNQIIDSDIEKAVIKIFTKEISLLPDSIFFVNGDYTFGYKEKGALIMTHYACDLLNNNFIKPTLLESHTGKLKTSEEWYTKLTNGKRLLGIPFNKLTLQVFGDGGALFFAMKPSVKSALVELAKSKNWSVATTWMKIKFDISRMPDSEIKDLLKSLL